MKTFLCALLCAVWLVPALPAPTATAAPVPATILNVSYDGTRTFYGEFNPLFAKDWKDKTGQDLTLAMSYGGSTMQARAILDGLDADVVTMNQDIDIDTLAERGGFVSKTWREEFPNRCVPYTSTILFLVRNGNPKGIKDWNDLVRPGLRVVMPNPKTSGNGRYSYLAAWGYALKKNGGDEAQAKTFVAGLFKNAEVFDTGSQAAMTFAQHGAGDVLLTFENEVYVIRKDVTLGGDKLQTVVPSMSILAEPPVAIVNKNVDKHGTRPVAQAYLQFLFTPASQETAAKNGFRPMDKDVLARHADAFPHLELFDVETVFGGWAKVQKTHFADGGVFDQIYSP